MSIIGRIISTISLLLCLAWLGLSWYEVVANNLTPGYLYSDYNFFIVVFGRG